MTQINQEIVNQLRTMARNGDSPARILHSLVDLLPTHDAHKVTLLKYMRSAFGLSLEQASPIAGWSADDAGELKDTQLNELVAPGIIDNRGQWDR